MAITLISGPANAGKAEVVMDLLRRHVAHGEEPVLVVPTHADADYHRRELAGEGVLMGVAVERFEGLIGEAVGRAGVGARVLDGLARERALAAVVARSSRLADAARASARRSAHPDRAPPVAGRGFVRALGELIAELQVRRVTPARFTAALESWAASNGGAGSAGEAARLFAGYVDLLEQIGRVSSEQRAMLALDALRSSPARWRRKPVLFYGFDDFTPLQLDAIETLGVVVGAPVTVSLTYEPGRTAFAGRAGTFQALAPIAAEHRALSARADYYAPRARAALSHLERALFEPDAGRVRAGGAVRLLEGGDERAELELVAREIAKLLADGTSPGEIAVLVRMPAATAELLQEVFAAAKIPYALQRRRPFADTAVGRALIGLLRCVPASAGARAVGGAASGGEGGLVGRSSGREGAAVDAVSSGEVADLLAWLRAPGLLERPELADWLEASSRRSGLRGADQARALWEERHWRLETIDYLRAATERGAGALIARASRELEWLFSAPRRGQASVLANDELDEARALAAGRRALAELSELARDAPYLAPSSPLELARALEGLQFVSGERPTAAAVAVVDPLALRARRVRALFVCRLQEGVLPAPARAQPLLGSEQRRALAQASGLSLGPSEDALAAERYLLYAAVSRAEELLVLSWHASGDDGAEQMRSLFVDDICDLFEGDLGERARGPLGAVIEPPRLEQAHAPAHVDSTAPVEHAATTRSSSPSSAPLRDEELLAELRAHTWSASSLEVWMSCPVRWLVERMLRAETLDPDAEPLTRGRLAHAALKDTLEGLRAETGSARLEPARLQRARELLRAALARHGSSLQLSPAPERRPGLRRRLEADLERYLEHAAAAGADCPGAERPPARAERPTAGAERPPARAERRHEASAALEPTHLELGFGFGDGDQRGEGSELPALDLGGGVMLRGRIDRVDVGEGGEAVVYDYKGRSVSPAARWSAVGELQVALYMRAVEDLLGLRAIGGFYQPLTGPDLRARGVLDCERGVQVGCVRADRRTGEELQALVGEAVAAARTAAAEAGCGELEARPQTCAFRGGCRYPTICRCEHR